MALALYRKYRPRTFAEVIGQEHVTEPLSQALRTGRLHHAYLFSGPRGCGKTSSARILARSLNCAQGPTPEPCGVCESCRALAADGAGSIDVIEIDAASHGGVDDARELRERAFFAPATSRFKIYVIDEAHMVSTQGFNALLKLVEEPPEYVKFIFATTEPDKVLGTIKSRTHHYPFRLIPPAVLRPYLEQLAEAEGVKIEPAVFPLVVRAGGGSVRDTLSVLDQLIAGAGPEGVSYARAVALLGVTDSALIDEMCDALAAGDGAAAYATVDRVVAAGHDPRRFAADLLERLRDLIILRQVPDAAAKGLIDGPADQLERMAAQAERLGPATLSRCADIVHDGLVEMRGTTSPRLLLELICARMLLPGADDSTGGLLQRLERMERRLAHVGDLPAGSAAPPASAPAPTTPPAATPAPAASDGGAESLPAGAEPGAAAARPVAPAQPTVPPSATAVARPATAAPEPTAAQPAPAAQPAAPVPAAPGPAVDMAEPAPGLPAGGTDIEAVQRHWDNIVEQTKHRRVVWTLMQNVTPAGLDRDTLVLAARTPGIANRFTDDSLLAVVRDALRTVLGVQWQVRCEVAGGQRDPAPAASRPAPAAPPRATAAGQPRGASAPGAGSGAGQQGRQGGRGGARTASGGQPPAAEEDDWPEPARPGGAAASAAPDDDWPEPTPPGGAAHADGSASSTPAGGGTGTTVGTGPGVGSAAAYGAGPGVGYGAGSAVGSAGNSGSVSGAVPASGGGPGINGGPRPAPPGSGLAAARAAAAGRGTRSTAPPAPRTAGAAPRTAEPDWAGEPPYDPDYDGPPGAAGNRSTVNYEGFDPGDEPLDEVIDERTARQTSEQQAVQLLQQALGAERIGEIDLR